MSGHGSTPGQRLAWFRANHDFTLVSPENCYIRRGLLRGRNRFSKYGVDASWWVSRSSTHPTAYAERLLGLLHVGWLSSCESGYVSLREKRNDGATGARLGRSARSTVGPKPRCLCLIPQPRDAEPATNSSAIAAAPFQSAGRTIWGRPLPESELVAARLGRDVFSQRHTERSFHRR